MRRPPHRGLLAAGALFVVLAGNPAAGAAQQQGSDSAERSATPFRVGEQLIYQVKYGRLPIGRASMSVLGIEDVRGRPAYHVAFRIDGGLPGLQVHDSYESWLDTATLASRRHVQEIREVRYRRTTRYEIFPEERKYRENDEDSLKTSVSSPLDEGSFVYFIRTVRVPVGRTREFKKQSARSEPGSHPGTPARHGRGAVRAVPDRRRASRYTAALLERGVGGGSSATRAASICARTAAGPVPPSTSRCVTDCAGLSASDTSAAKR